MCFGLVFDVGVGCGLISVSGCGGVFVWVGWCVCIVSFMKCWWFVAAAVVF